MTTQQALLLEVEHLNVHFAVRDREVTAVDGVSFSLAAGETMGLVGESGSGKSVSAFALVQLLAANGRMDAKRLSFEGRDLRPLRNAQAARGRDIAFIFQNPRAALNPIRAIGQQLEDAIDAGRRPSKSQRERRERALALLESVRIKDASNRYQAYPHELSGGMCQRVLIAMAIAAEPKLLIADEPTTGLDATTQQHVLDLIRDLSRERGLAVILITHDLGLAARYCNRLTVMRKGHVIESGDTQDILGAPRDPYTIRLVAATPTKQSTLSGLLPAKERDSLGDVWHAAAEQYSGGECLLALSRLQKTFPARGGQPAQIAVQGVDFRLDRGRSIGIVGESGSGKTTIARMIARLVEPTAGSIRFGTMEICDIDMKRFARSEHRRRIQVVFQDPGGSLNPRFTAYEAIVNQLRRCLPAISREKERERAISAAESAGLPVDLLQRFPHQLSGGQQARVGIARALVVEPELIVFDEPTSALDVSIQAILLNQLDLLRKRLQLSFVFVSHDLNVVRMMCEEVLVMKDGAVVEHGPADDVLLHPKHRYTRLLVDAIPFFDKRPALPEQVLSAP